MKIELKKIKLEDAKFAFEMKQNEEFKKYFPEYLLSNNLEEEKKLIKDYIKGDKKNQKRQYLVLCNGEKVGTLSIYKANPKHKRGSIGYAVKKDFWGKGIATKMCKKGLEIMQKDFGMHGVEATSHPDNIASQKVLENNGFKKVGLMEDYYFANGKFLPRILYWKTLD